MPRRDDPDLQCKPASLTNVIGIPDPPFEIHLGAYSVEINFEYMDVGRRVPLDLDVAIEEAPYTVSDHPHLGRSIGHFDGDTLVIETADIVRGFLDTLRVPYPQSDEMRTVERFTADGDRLRVDITHTDPVYYSEAFDVSFELIRVDFGILEFGCTLETASYEDRL